MAKAKVPIDQFANRAMVTVTMSAANTITFTQINFGVGTFQGVGLVLHKVEWYPTLVSLAELGASTDALYMAITTRDSLVDLIPNSQDIIAQKSILEDGAGGAMFHLPEVTDFTDQPGGGLIMPANPLFAGVTTVGAAAASQVELIMYYTFKELSDKDYIELIQTLVPANF